MYIAKFFPRFFDKLAELAKILADSRKKKSIVRAKNGQFAKKG